MLNKNKIFISFFIVFFLFISITPLSTIYATDTSTDLSKLVEYWKDLDYTINIKSNLEAAVSETHTIVFNKRLDGQAFQSLLYEINISNYAKLTELKVYEKTKDGKLIEYLPEGIDVKNNGKYYIIGPDTEQKIFTIRLFFDAKNEEKTFIVKYNLLDPRYSNFISYYKDYDDIIMSPIPNSTGVFIKNITVHIILPEKVTENDVYFWGLPKSNQYKIQIYSNKISFSGLIDKTDTAIGFDMLVKAGIFYIPPDITRKTSDILAEKLNNFNNTVDTATANANMIRSASITAGVIISLIAVIYILRVYLNIRLRKVSTTNKTFNDVDPLKYPNFKSYYTGMIIRKKIGKNDLTSMLIDLCIRKYLSLRIIRSKNSSGKIVDLYILDKSDEKVKNDVLSNTEKIFMSYMFKKDNSIYLESLKDSYKSRSSYYYSFIGREVLDNKFFAMPSFIKSFSLYKLLIKLIFSILSILMFSFLGSYWSLALAPLFFVFFTDYLVFENPLGTRIKKNLIAFQDFSLNWKEKIDKNFEKRIPYFVSMVTLNNVVAAISKEKTMQELDINWLTLENKNESIEEKNLDKEMSVEKEVGEEETIEDIPTWNDLLTFVDKIRKTFSK